MCDHIAYCERNELKAELAAKERELGTWQHENGRRSAELAQVREILSDREARIAELEAAGKRLGDAAITGILDGNDALARAEARITEFFEARLQRQYAILLEHKSRAERAEAELDISREAHRMVQSALLSQAAETERAEAERDAMREALEPCAGWLRYAYNHISSVTADKVKVHLPKIDAALAPSPAGRVVTHEEGARMIQEPEPDDGAIVHEDGSVTRPSPAGREG